jgi:SAM-dependent methyltransferase
MRLGLAKPGDLRLTTFDLRPRINEHLAAARARAARRETYTVQLVRDPEAGWAPELVAYFQRFGDRVGAAAKPTPPPGGAGTLEMRAVGIRPDVVSLVTPRDLNVVLQRPDGLPASERFDLIVATNILVYYDVFEQSLALANVSRMLRPGGFLLSNNALLELDATPMRSVGYRTSVYSDRPNDGDHIVWYRRLEEPAPAP